MKAITGIQGWTLEREAQAEPMPHCTQKARTHADPAGPLLGQQILVGPDGHMLSVQAVHCGAGPWGTTLWEMPCGAKEEFPQETTRRHNPCALHTLAWVSMQLVWSLDLRSRIHPGKRGHEDRAVKKVVNEKWWRSHCLGGRNSENSFETNLCQSMTRVQPQPSYCQDSISQLHSISAHSVSAHVISAS